jgi:hypothetical protein
MNDQINNVLKQTLTKPVVEIEEVQSRQITLCKPREKIMVNQLILNKRYVTDSALEFLDSFIHLITTCQRSKDITIEEEKGNIICSHNWSCSPKFSQKVTST